MVKKTARTTVADMQEQFKSAGLDTPALDARLLAQGMLGITQEDLLLHPDRILSEAENKKLEDAAQRRLRHEPVSRILGQRSFWKSEFKISPDTLDPRPDSETLIEAVLNHVDKNAQLRILDLGTGTGCLLLSLLQELPQAKGTGIDISPGAIEIARQNAENLHLSNRSLFIISNWSKMGNNPLFDIVISNPPYIANAEIPKLAPEVSQYDPYQALAGGADGLDCYRAIVGLLPHLLTKNGKVFFEIGYDQANSVKRILADGKFSVLQTLSDIAGHDRCVIAQWKGLP